MLVDDDGFNELDVDVAERIPPEVDATLGSLRNVVLAHGSVEGVNLSHELADDKPVDGGEFGGILVAVLQELLCTLESALINKVLA